MFEYWIVVENKTGRTICQCADINDAIMVVSFDSQNRSYTQKRFILDQIIDVTSTTDKQLPGQIGLPASQEELPFVELQQQISLPESQQKPIVI